MFLRSLIKIGEKKFYKLFSRLNRLSVTETVSKVTIAFVTQIRRGFRKVEKCFFVTDSNQSIVFSFEAFAFFFLQSNFIEIALWHRCSHVNLLHIFRTPISTNTYGGLLLLFLSQVKSKIQFSLISTIDLIWMNYIANCINVCFI